MSNDLVAYFDKIRVPFFVAMVLPVAIFLPATYFVFDYFDLVFIISELILISMGVAAIGFRDRRFQGSIVCIWLLILIVQESMQAAVGQ